MILRQSEPNNLLACFLATAAAVSANPPGAGGSAKFFVGFVDFFAMDAIVPDNSSGISGLEFPAVSSNSAVWHSSPDQTVYEIHIFTLRAR